MLVLREIFFAFLFHNFLGIMTHIVVLNTHLLRGYGGKERGPKKVQVDCESKRLNIDRQKVLEEKLRFNLSLAQPIHSS